MNVYKQVCHDLKIVIVRLFTSKYKTNTPVEISLHFKYVYIQVNILWSYTKRATRI